MRQVVIDTETTGLEHQSGHRIIEIGGIEMVSRRRTGRTFHRYLNPERAVDDGALQVHGLTDEFLADKPRFAEVAAELLEFVRGAEVVIHNAPFDVGFLDAELERMGGALGRFGDHCSVCDTLEMARLMHPGQRNSLDALCKRYQIDNSARTLHGALLDAEILADVYLAMTGGQATLLLDAQTASQEALVQRAEHRAAWPQLRVVQASEAEAQAHAARLTAIAKASGGRCLWAQAEGGGG
ncbi:MAG: DNA polymerase III subunit epsilon [Gammaproteobacteria bacterium]